MAEKRSEDGEDGCRGDTLNVTRDKIIRDPCSRDNGTNLSFLSAKATLAKNSSKRCSSTSPTSSPTSKSPRTDLPSSSSSQTLDGGEQSDMDKQELQAENSADSTKTRRKSWRRATLTRRSLPALPNPYQALSRSICTSLPQHERLEKLMEASMKLAMERTQLLLTSEPNISQEAFQKQAEHIKTEWGCLAKTIPSGQYLHTLSAVSSKDPAVQRAMEKIQKAINRLQAESESWEALLIKHRSKAEELERKVGHGQETSVTLDLSSLAQSSQYHFIQKKPNYHHLLQQQLPRLHTIEMIMDTQSRMVENILSIKEHAQMLVKETSSQLAAQAGFQNLPSDPLKNLMAPPFTASTT